MSISAFAFRIYSIIIRYDFLVPSSAYYFIKTTNKGLKLITDSYLHYCRLEFDNIILIVK